jgi:hypothetical protein
MRFESEIRMEAKRRKDEEAKKEKAKKERLEKEKLEKQRAEQESFGVEWTDDCDEVILLIQRQSLRTQQKKREKH